MVITCIIHSFYCIFAAQTKKQIVMYKQIRNLKKGDLFAFCGYVYSRGEYCLKSRTYRCYVVANDGGLLSLHDDFYPSDYVEIV